MAHKKNRRNVRSRGRRQAGKKAPLSVLVWTALILFVLVVFLFNRAAIRDVTERTELVAVLQRSVDNAVGHTRSPEGAAPLPEVTGTPPLATPDVIEPPREAPRTAPEPQVVATAPTPPSEPALPAAKPPPGPAPMQQVAAPAQQDASPPPPVRSAKPRTLFFAAVSEAGDIAVTGVTRAVDDTASPLTETLKALFAGPAPSELNQGLVTMIPSAATLNRVYVSERVAYIDVSESFRFNPLGREGADAQLEQIVFSATEFPGVELVQILIEGGRVNFLGPEGTYIGEPIGRTAFVGDPPAP